MSRQNFGFLRASLVFLAVLAAVTGASFSAEPPQNAPSYGDKVVFHDGRVLYGHVVLNSPDTLKIELKKGSAALPATFPGSSVAEVVLERRPKGQVAPAATQPQSSPPATATFVVTQSATTRRTPGYIVAPLKGEFGLYVTAELLTEYIDIARREHAQLLVLDIDSGGGRVDELHKMIQLVQGTKDVKVAAYVRKAYSAAAMFSMVCPTIVIAPEGAIGAAVILKVGPDGTPQNIEEKFESAQRAALRSAIEHAGHEPLLAEAMMRTDIAIEREGRGTTAKISEMRSSSARGTVVKPLGKILTLTATEALDCGLVAAVADSPAACLSAVGLPGLPESSTSAVRAHAKSRETLDNAVQGYIRVMRRARAVFTSS